MCSLPKDVGFEVEGLGLDEKRFDEKVYAVECVLLL
jgi:hypothetical protein